MNCKQCENFETNYPIKVIDEPGLNFMDEETYHFEDGVHCTYNGLTGVTSADLQKGNCRCRQ